MMTRVRLLPPQCGERPRRRQPSGEGAYPEEARPGRPLTLALWACCLGLSRPTQPSPRTRGEAVAPGRRARPDQPDFVSQALSGPIETWPQIRLIARAARRLARQLRGHRELCRNTRGRASPDRAGSRVDGQSECRRAGPARGEVLSQMERALFALHVSFGSGIRRLLRLPAIANGWTTNVVFIVITPSPSADEPYVAHLAVQELAPARAPATSPRARCWGRSLVGLAGAAWCATAAQLALPGLQRARTSDKRDTLTLPACTRHPD